jgi:hypothetical protein
VIKSEMRVEVGVLIELVRSMRGKVLADPVGLAELQRRLEVVHAELRNRPPVTRAAHTSVKVTPEIEARMIALHEQFPDMPQHEIAKRTDTNQGRVSETLAGVRQ